MLKALDLFCGAGGAGVGLARAGFEVIGVDLAAQPRYPFRFVQADAMSYPLEGFDLVWASPPCQRYSAMSSCRVGLAGSYPDLISFVRQRLLSAGVPFVIENVVSSPLIEPIMLCGRMFELELYRHRLFECSWPAAAPEHPKHLVPASKAGHWKPGTVISVAGHAAPIAVAKAAMGIEWMNRSELAEAIPPAYSEYIGRSLLSFVALERPRLLL